MRQSVNQVHVKKARDSRIEHDKPIIPSFLVLSRKSFDIKVAQSIVWGVVRLSHPSMVGCRVRADLRRLTWSSGTWVRNRSIDLGGGGPTRGRSADAATLARSGTSSAGRGLGRKAAGSGSLGVLRLERRRLRRRRRRRRRALQSRRRLRDLVRRGLLLLRRRRWWNRAAGAALTGHNGAEGIRAHTDGWWRGLWGARVRRGTDHGALRSAASGLLKLATEVTNLLFEPVKQRR